jgi:hypothetical protein
VAEDISIVDPNLQKNVCSSCIKLLEDIKGEEFSFSCESLSISLNQPTMATYTGYNSLFNVSLPRI